MKLVTAVEVERFYAICFLSNMKLNRDENDLASRLIGIYFNFFKLHIGKGEVDTKILSAVLTGVNKTYLCARVKTDAITEQTEALYTIIHLSKFNTSLQALMLLHQVMDVRGGNLKWFRDACSNLAPTLKKLTNSVKTNKNEMMSKLNNLRDLNNVVRTQIEIISKAVDKNSKNILQKRVRRISGDPVHGVVVQGPVDGLATGIALYSVAVQGTIDGRTTCRPRGWRFGTWNVGTLTGRSLEVVEELQRRMVDVAALQEIRWKGEGTRFVGAKGGRYKLWWKGDDRTGGVGVIVREELVEKVLEVRRRSNGVIVVVMVFGKVIVRVISGYAPQQSRKEEEKDRFYDDVSDEIGQAGDKESDRFYVALYKKMLDHELPTSNKLPLFLNILYKSMKKDHIEIRVMAFVKRLLQVCQFMSPSMICSSLYLLSQLASEKSSVFKFCKENEETDDDESCDNNESKETMVQHMDAGYEKVETNVLNKRSPTSFKSSWMHKTNSNCRVLSNVYDPLHRNPAFCRADMDCLWELNIFLYHYHPTVVIFAKSIVNGEKIDYSGDPLENYAFKKFLDRFICKNPKKVHEGPNENQPLKESIKLESENCDIAESEDCQVADQEEDCVDDDEDIDDDGKFDEEEVDFGKDFKDEFKDLIASDIDNETLMDEDESNDKVQAAGEYLREIESSDEESSNNEDNEDIDDQTLGRYTDKVLKQMKWEEGNEKVWSKKHRIHRKRSNNTNYLRKNIQKEFCKNKRFKR
ncbi:hypothetical protein HELRODRAFT_182310 [Helobdella robusta]|uniref:Uncharacterized protein n=1 Tax=Helobdella robusta TaxID=6412 RepID=T1FI14_HELRO|nr:hypothetical protein HELRODRAFT_182310 [Helobdella robusta]ESN91059.1 hypothetical protein HELRODRAFT_182310 [Helobdella robusta]